MFSRLLFCLNPNELGNTPSEAAEDGCTSNIFLAELLHTILW